MFARTPRLLLRPGWKEDASALAAATEDFSVAGRLQPAPWLRDVDDADAHLGTSHGSLPKFLIFARTHGAPRLVGGIGLALNDSGVELGYWITRAYWGLGFATEAGRAVVDLADKGLRLPRLVAGHLADNPASARVLHKLGFQRSGDRSSPLSRSLSSDPSVAYIRPAFAKMREQLAANVGYDREGVMAA